MTTRKASEPAAVGKDAVVAAVLAAAAELYAEKGPAATSIREVATRSGVNHGLVFRHFGSKERLVTATLNHLGDRVAQLIEDRAPADLLDAALNRHSTVMARALLEGFPIEALQTNFPGVTLFLDAIRPQFCDDRSARLAAANAVALQLGWRLFGPFLRVSAGLDDITEDQLREAVNDEVARVITPRPNQEDQ